MCNSVQQVSALISWANWWPAPQSALRDLPECPSQPALVQQKKKKKIILKSCYWSFIFPRQYTGTTCEADRQFTLQKRNLTTSEQFAMWSLALALQTRCFHGGHRCEVRRDGTRLSATWGVRGLWAASLLHTAMCYKLKEQWIIMNLKESNSWKQTAVVVSCAHCGGFMWSKIKNSPHCTVSKKAINLKPTKQKTTNQTQRCFSCAASEHEDL